MLFTPVILVCVHDLDEDLVVTHNLLYSIFSAYGTILRILIFERANTFKAFLEFSNIHSATTARKSLNRALLFNGRCRMSIYPSNLQTIKFQNNYPGGIDYTCGRQPYIFPGNMDGLQASLQPVMHMSPDRLGHGEFNSSPRSHSSLQDGSSKSSPVELRSPFNIHAHVEEDIQNDDEILQMINRHHKEAKMCENEAEKICSDNEDNEVDDFNDMVNNAFSVSSPFELLKRESFNSVHSEDKGKTTFDNSSSFSYKRRNTRLPCFPHSNPEVPISIEQNSFSNCSWMSNFSEPPSSRLYSMEDIPNSFDFNDEKVSQPMYSHFSNVSFENIPSVSDKTDNGDPGNSKENDRNGVNQVTNNTSNIEGREDEEKKSPVLHVLGIENKEATARMLFNIFSNFGNIVKLIFIKTRAVALVEFENVLYATFAKENLNNVSFMGKPLRITYSKYPNIQLQPGQEEKYPDQLILSDEKSFRFKEGKNVVIAPPSTTLHVSNLSKEICKDKKAITNYFSTYGDVKAIKSMFGENGKNMCLIKMKTIEESLKTMACLHDTELGGRKIQVSFSRSKI
jgi:RNA recognition motif-containing protein